MTRAAAPNTMAFPTWTKVLTVVYVLCTGVAPAIIQAAFNGVDGGAGQSFIFYAVLEGVREAMLLWLMFRFGRGEYGVFHPIVFMMLIWPIVTKLPEIDRQLGPIADMLSGEPVAVPDLHALLGMAAPDLWDAKAYLGALELLALFSLCVGAGVWRMKPDQVPHAHDPQRPPVFLRAVCFAAIVVGAVGSLAFVMVRGGFNAQIASLSEGRFVALGGLGPIIVLLHIGAVAALVWIAAAPKDARTVWFWGVVAVVAASIFVVNGSRGQALMAIAALAVAWALRVRRLPWRLFLLATPIALVGFGVLTIVRTAHWEGIPASQALRNADIGAALQAAREETAQRDWNNGAVPVIVEGADKSGGWLWGQTYVAALLAPLPRAIWESKPRGAGSLYAQYFFNEEETGTSIPIGPVAEAYWNFGILGVAVVFFVFGVAMKKVRIWAFAPAAGSPFRLALYTIFLTTFSPTTNALVIFEQQAGLLLILYLGWKVLSGGIHRPDDLRRPLAPVVYAPSATLAAERSSAIGYRGSGAP
jgi:hypothetical protein